MWIRCTKRCYRPRKISLGTCLESDVVSYLQPLLRMELCTCAVWQGTWPTWCKSLGHTCHHMSHSKTTMLQHKVLPDFKLNVIRLANNFNQSYFPYTSVMCASATYWPVVWGYTSVTECTSSSLGFQERNASTCLQLSDIATNKVHGQHLASFHFIHTRAGR